MHQTRYTFMETPLGPLLLAGGPAGLEAVNFQRSSHPHTPEPDWLRDDAAFDAARRQLDDYFAGTRTEFDLPLHPQGTAFQRKVWTALRGIPYGTTITYGELARRVGQPSAARAVGAANGRNPLPIVIPCHRVIGSNGQLTGFYGGLHLKEGLLSLERAHCPWEGAQAKLI